MWTIARIDDTDYGCEERMPGEPDGSNSMVSTFIVTNYLLSYIVCKTFTTKKVYLMKK